MHFLRAALLLLSSAPTARDWPLCMAPDPAQGHLQTGSLFLTAPVRRRSTAGCPAGMIHPADAEDSSSTLLGPSSQCQGVQHCCHHAVHVGTHIQQADGCCDVKPSASAASSQLLSGTNNAVRHQGLLLRTSSSGPVTTRIHAAAICCKCLVQCAHTRTLACCSASPACFPCFHTTPT